MKEFTYRIADPVGIHARPAGIFAKKAAEFESKVTVVKGEKSADTRRIMHLMGLGIKKDDIITVRCEGNDEDRAAEELKNFLADNNF